MTEKYTDVFIFDPSDPHFSTKWHAYLTESVTLEDNQGNNRTFVKFCVEAGPFCILDLDEANVEGSVADRLVFKCVEPLQSEVQTNAEFDLVRWDDEEDESLKTHAKHFGQKVKRDQKKWTTYIDFGPYIRSLRLADPQLSTMFFNDDVQDLGPQALEPHLREVGPGPVHDEEFDRETTQRREDPTTRTIYEETIRVEEHIVKKTPFVHWYFVVEKLVLESNTRLRTQFEKNQAKRRADRARERAALAGAGM